MLAPLGASNVQNLQLKLLDNDQSTAEGYPGFEHNWGQSDMSASKYYATYAGSLHKYLKKENCTSGM